jgi:ribosomal subunit interface protein
MTFPSINYHFNDLDEARPLTEVIEVKFNSLVKYLHENESVSCEVEFSKVAAKQNGQIHKVDVNLVVNGTLFRVEATEESFEQAIDEVRSELDKELRRTKDKQATLDKQAGRAVKEMLSKEEE